MRKFIETYKNGNEEGFEAASMVNVISEFDVSSKKTHTTATSDGCELISEIRYRN